MALMGPDCSPCLPVQDACLYSLLEHSAWRLVQEDVPLRKKCIVLRSLCQLVLLSQLLLASILTENCLLNLVLMLSESA